MAYDFLSIHIERTKDKNNIDTIKMIQLGLIKNYFYHKVNPEAPDSTLKLSSGTDKLPLYPKIGEIVNAKTSKSKEKKVAKSFESKEHGIKMIKLTYSFQTKLQLKTGRKTQDPSKKERWFMP